MAKLPTVQTANGRKEGPNDTEERCSEKSGKFSALFDEAPCNARTYWHYKCSLVIVAVLMYIS